MTTRNDAIKQAAEALAGATAILVTSGAGMSADSGLPTFRGADGFWNAYPPYRKLNLDFYDLANPEWFMRDPELAWGFYGHRLNLYREVQPHEGYSVLTRLSKQLPMHVATTNVDGAFVKAGMRAGAVWEAHGSIHWLQHVEPADDAPLVPAHAYTVDVDPETMRARGDLPTADGSLLRPNIVMFGDWLFDDRRETAQSLRYERWVDSIDDSNLVVVEVGAGAAIPTARFLGLNAAIRSGGTLIRINTEDARIDDHVRARIHRGIEVECGAAEALVEINHRLLN